MEHKRIWGLVANGGRARVVKHLRSEYAREILDFESDQLSVGISQSVETKSRFATSAISRDGVELHADPVRNKERIFAERVASYFAVCVNSGQIDEIVVVASPRTLGDLRSAYSPQVSARIVKEISTDSTQLSTADILHLLDSLYSAK